MRDETDYDQGRLAELQDWLARPPGLIARGFGRTTSPVVRAVKPMLPATALERAFRAANETGTRLAWRRQMLESQGVASTAELAKRSLQDCDTHWRRVRRRMMFAAGGSGALTGLGGAAGWVLDVPALLLLALEGIHRSALCYGIEFDNEQAPLALFSLAAANTMEEKELAWQAALRAQTESTQLLEGLERTLNQSFAKQAAVVGFERVAGQMGLNLGRRKALGMVPLAGAVVGGSVNAWYLRDVVQTTRYFSHALRLA